LQQRRRFACDGALGHADPAQLLRYGRATAIDERSLVALTQIMNWFMRVDSDALEERTCI
jgi:hypothetical protein